MSKYELWVNSLEKEGVYPYLLEENNDVKLLQVKKRYEHNHNFSYITTYHVWNGDVWRTSNDYCEAYQIYEHEVEKNAKRCFDR